MSRYATESDKYIIFVDSVMRGYLDDKNSAQLAVLELARKLVEEKRKSSTEQVRVFTEDKDSGINIYTQILGSYINGAVTLSHVISWQALPPFDILCRAENEN